MAIPPQYQQIYDQTKNMQFRMNDLVGHTNPTATLLHNEMHQLTTDIELGKNPRDIENRIKVVQNQMHQVEHQGQSLMSYGHAQEIHHTFENMRQDVRHFGNYS